MAKPRVIVITGTDTSVGKTVLTVLLTRRWIRMGHRVLAVKPVGSGGRTDARALSRALGGAWPIESINPWAFRAPLTPLIAAEREGRQVRLCEVLAFLKDIRRHADTLLVEGAGGLRSPLGLDFDTRDLIRVLGAEVIVVASNRLGVLNHVLLTWDALPRAARARATVALMGAHRPTLVTRSNEEVLRRRLGSLRVVEVPFLGESSRRDPSDREWSRLEPSLAAWDQPRSTRA